MAKYMDPRWPRGWKRSGRATRFTLIDPARLPQRPLQANRLPSWSSVLCSLWAAAWDLRPSEYSDESIRDYSSPAPDHPLSVPRHIPLIENESDIHKEEMEEAGFSFRPAF